MSSEAGLLANVPNLSENQVFTGYLPKSLSFVVLFVKNREKHLWRAFLDSAAFLGSC